MSIRSTGDRGAATSLAADPFSSLAVHYGMLLGVPDFQVLMANPRGKLRLHQAWQHGPGVVWGYGVAARADSAELTVGPGLAVDGLGREVALGVEHCVDVSQWLDEHGEEARARVDGDVRTVDVQVVLRYRACLTRPVPAMSSGCDGQGSDTEYSRVLETGELFLRPYPRGGDDAPEPPPDDRGDAFPRLRALLRGGPAAPDDGAATDWSTAFRTVAAEESAALAPPAYRPAPAATSTRLFPVDEPHDVVLADLPGLQVVGAGGGARVVAPTVDLSVRRTHLPTWVLSELLAEAAGGAGRPVTDSGGPRVESVVRAAATVTLTLTADVVPGTVGDALSVHALDLTAGDPRWAEVDVRAATTYTAASPGAPATIAVDLPAEPTADLSFRLVLRGTGATPVVGVVGGRPVPLAGRSGGPAGGAHDGQDVVELLTP